MESYVRLTLAVDATTPQEAVMGFIQRIVEHGLADWIYRVEQDGTFTFLNAKGEVFDLAGTVSELAATQGLGEAEAPLLELAKQLNDQRVT
jgi:hypothetical protein